MSLVDWTPVRALLRPGDLWHLHHPETVLYRRSLAASSLETLTFLALLLLARGRGVRLLWTIHDLGSNDCLHPRLESWFWSAFIARVDAFVCLTEHSRTLALERFPALAGRPGYIVPHGHYRDAYPRTVSRESARQRLSLPPQATVLLHFGLMRPYKNVPHLIRTFRTMPRPGTVLLVVGKPYDAAIEGEIRCAANGASNVRLDLRHVPPEEVQLFFAAADLVVLPYRRILNSGVVMLSLTFARPVLVPDLGAMRDQQERFGADWVRLYRGDLTVGALAAATEWARPPRPQSIDLDGFGWRELALRTRAIYEELGLWHAYRPWAARRRESARSSAEARET